MNWKKVGGVLLMGYELYRLLATRTQRKKRKTKKEAAGPVCIDIEEEDKEKLMLDGQSSLEKLIEWREPLQELLLRLFILLKLKASC